MGTEDFRKSLQIYLDLFKYKTAETDDLRKIFEENSGESLQEFFDQWMYRAGHPELTAIVEINNSTMNIKIQQTQANLFRFPLDVIVVLGLSDGTEKKIQDTLLIEGKETEKKYKFPNGAVIKRVPVDPYFKILKKMDLIIQDTGNSILLNSLMDGETVIERIYAARALIGKQSTDLVNPLKSLILREDLYWGVRAEAAKTLGSIKIEDSYGALKVCCQAVQNNKVKELLLEALGSFSKPDSFDLLKPILENDDEPSNVQYAAAIALAKSGNEANTIS